MITSFRKLLSLLTPRERRGFFLLTFVAMVVALFEAAGVASILPFMAVLAEPQSIHTNAFLSRLYAAFGFTSDENFLIFLGVATFSIFVTGIFLKIGALYAMVRFSNMRAFALSSRLLRGYLRQPYTWFLNRHSADLGKTVLSEVDGVVNNGFMPAMRIVSNLFMVVFIVALLVVVQPLVAVGSAVVLVASYTLVFVTARRHLGRIGQQRYAANGARYKIAQEATGGIKDVKLMGLEEGYINRFRKPAYAMATANTAKVVIGDAPRHLLEGIAFGGMMLMILYLLVTGSGELGGILPILGVYAFAGLRLLPALQQVYNQMTSLRFGRVALDALHADLEEIRANAEAEPERAQVAPIRLRERLELRDIHYAYPRAERAALRGLSLRIEANTTVGIVGGTGAGKTTAVDLVLGLLAPQRGALEVDGIEIGPSNLRAWQNAIGYVPQQIFLTDDTVASNIAFGQPRDRIDRAAIERASRIAELHDFVMEELPQGYDTPVGERGVRLSGGQRQRIGIARALYHDPDVLILDEATSALDNLTERAVMDAVHNLGRAKTIVLIAHRLSTVKDCDTIFMLERGRVVAEGTYDALIDTSQKFRAMAVGES